MTNNTDHRKIILKEIEKTKKLIEDYKELTQPIEPDDAYGRISRMDAINNKSVMEASLRQTENKLKNLEEVFSRIDTKDFGKCRKCGLEISLKRIIFKPDSLLCVNCAE